MRLKSIGAFLSAGASRLIVLFVFFSLSGCVGSAVLNRGTQDGKGVRDTPSLHTVPERPEKISAAQREDLTRSMEDDFNANSKNLER